MKNDKNLIPSDDKTLFKKVGPESAVETVDFKRILAVHTRLPSTNIEKFPKCLSCSLWLLEPTESKDAHFCDLLRGTDSERCSKCERDLSVGISMSSTHVVLPTKEILWSFCALVLRNCLGAPLCGHDWFLPVVSHSMAHCPYLKSHVGFSSPNLNPKSCCSHYGPN